MGDEKYTLSLDDMWRIKKQLDNMQSDAWKQVYKCTICNQDILMLEPLLINDNEIICSARCYEKYRESE